MRISCAASWDFSHYDRRVQRPWVDHIVLAGGCASIHGVDEVVATRTQFDTLVANPFANMVLSDRVRARALLTDASALMVACGLALRRFDTA